MPSPNLRLHFHAVVVGISFSLCFSLRGGLVFATNFTLHTNREVKMVFSVYDQPSYSHVYIYIYIYQRKSNPWIPDHWRSDLHVFVPTTLSKPKIHLTFGGSMLNSGSVVVHQRDFCLYTHGDRKSPGRRVVGPFPWKWPWKWLKPWGVILTTYPSGGMELQGLWYEKFGATEPCNSLKDLKVMIIMLPRAFWIQTFIKIHSEAVCRQNLKFNHARIPEVKNCEPPLKMHRAPKGIRIVFQTSIFSCELLISGSVSNLDTPNQKLRLGVSISVRLKDTPTLNISASKSFKAIFQSPPFTKAFIAKP